MKKNINKKKPRPSLKWIMGLEFAGILVFGLILVFLLLNSRRLSSPLYANEFPTLIPTSSFQPAPTGIVLPTLTATIPTLPSEIAEPVVFDPASANTVLPDEILQEVTYYPGGGGGPDDLFYCHNEKEPTLVLGLNEATDLEISKAYLPFIFVTCGWQENEQVTITIINPEGQSFQQTSSPAPDPPAYASGPLKGYWVGQPAFPMEILQGKAGDSSDLFRLHGIVRVMPGTYQLQFEGQSGSVRTSVQVIRTDQARAEISSQGGIILFGLAPNERVQIIYYPEQGEPAWNEYQTVSNGQLWIKELPPGLYSFFGEISGYIGNAGGFGPATLKCGNALPTRTGPGDFPRLAAFLKETGLPLYREPDLNSLLMAVFSYESPRGPYVFTISQPICVENSTWWKVRTMDNQVGWVMESDEQSYYFEDGFSSPDCDVTSKFVIGEVVRVTMTDGKPLNLQQTPERSTSILAEIPEGTRLTIRDGPQCGTENTRWWYVETDTNLSGWVAEGTRRNSQDIYYLEPWR
jgi:hypothetical protein